MVSIHVNAAGNGSKWLNATGWSVFTCSGQTESDRLAECLCESAIKNFPGRRIRTDMSDGDRDWENDFYILRKSWCPAVLTENFSLSPFYVALFSKTISQAEIIGVERNYPVGHGCLCLLLCELYFCEYSYQYLFPWPAAESGG